VTFELLDELQGQEPASLAQIFRALEDLKRELPIASYAVNQTTLEQIFIRMATKHNAVSEF